MNSFTAGGAPGLSVADGRFAQAVAALLHGGGADNLCEVKRVLDDEALFVDLASAAIAEGTTPETLAVELVTRHRIRHDDAATLEQEDRDSQHYRVHYRGRAVLELLQNLHDSVAAPEGMPEIGKFGLGVKSLAGICDRILLRSGPFALRFDPDQARSVRQQVDLVCPPMPLFLLPFRLASDDIEIDAVPDSDTPGLGMLQSRGRRWLWYSHHGKEFSARDVDGFRRRHSTGKRRGDAGISNASRTTLLFRLIDADGAPSLDEDVEAELQRMSGQALLFLPSLRRLHVETTSGARDISVETVSVATRDDTEIVTTYPDGRQWLRWWSPDRCQGLAFPLDGRKPDDTFKFASWFPVVDADPGLPFIIHDGLESDGGTPGLQVTDNRNGLSGDGDGTREVAGWVAARVMRVCTELMSPESPISRAAQGFRHSLPGAVLPQSCARGYVPANWRPGTTSEHADLLRAHYVDLLTRIDAPLLPTHRDDRLVQPSRAFCLPVESADDRSDALVPGVVARLEEASRRIAVSSDSSKWLEDHAREFRVDGPPFVFAALERLSSESLRVALDAIAGEAVERGDHEVGRCVAISPGTPHFDSAAALLRILGRRAGQIGPAGRTPVPVVGPVEQRPRALILVQELPDAAARAMKLVGYVPVAPCVRSADQFLTSRGVQSPDPLKMLAGLEVPANELADRCDPKGHAAARDLWEAACWALDIAWRGDLLPRSVEGSTPPGVGKLLSCCYQMELPASGPHWESQLPALLGLSHLPVATSSGRLRCVGDVSILQDPALPATLRVDLRAFALWLGGSAPIDPVRLLEFAGAWPGHPLCIRWRSLETTSLHDEQFDELWRRWPFPRGWEDLRRVETNVEAGDRLPARWLKRELPRNSRGAPSSLAAGHRNSQEKPLVVIDAPLELRTEEGVLPEAAEGLLKTLMALRWTNGVLPLAWSWFADANARRNNGKNSEQRTSAPGDVMSPLLFRLRKTRFLELREDVGTPGHCLWPSRLTPSEAAGHPRRTRSLPWHLLPLVESLSGDKAQALCVSQPPLDLTDEKGAEPSDPRWVLATLIRMRWRWEAEPERPPADELALVVARLMMQLAQALDATGPGERRLPGAGETWPDFYGNGERSDIAIETRLGSWLKATVRGGVFGREEEAHLRTWPGNDARCSEFLDHLPVFVVRDAVGEFLSLHAARAAPVVVAADRLGEDAMLAKTSLGVVAFPVGFLRFARLLRLPLLEFEKEERPPRVTRPSWACGFERAIRRAIPWLLAAVKDRARASLNVDRLHARFEHEIAWFYAENLSATRRLVGFPGRTVRASTGVVARLLSQATETSGPEIAVLGTLTDIRDSLHEFARPLADAMELEAAAISDTIENVLRNCADEETWQALMSESGVVPARTASFLRRKGWMPSGSPDRVRRLSNLLCQVVSACELPDLDMVRQAQDENEAWSELAGALVRRFGVDIPKPTFSGDEDSEAWLSWFLVELIRVGCLDAAVVQRGMRLRNIRMTRFADGAELARSWGEVHRRLYPYFDALKRSGNVPDDAPFLGGFDPQWLPLRDETHLWSVTREVFPQSVQPGIVREALNDALNQPALEEALDRALSVHGIAPPEDRARLRGLWSGCLRGVARTVEGVAALAAATEDMLKGVSDSYSLWRSNLDHAVALVLDGIEDLPAFTTWGLADLLRLNRFGEDDALAGPEAALHLVCEGARARYPERFEELLAQERRPFVVLGNRYPTKEAAQEALEERRAELQPPLVAAAQEFRRPAQSASTNPRGEERGSKARVVRFSPRAGLLGREGEEYLLRHMKDGMCLPVPSACDLRAFDVSTREEAERTSAIAEVREWLSQAGVVEPSVTPGFDVLATYLSGGRRLWDGIEVKTSSDHEASVIRVNMTENEWIAARREGGEGSWPIDTYRVCCILRFFSVDRDRTLLVPRVVWMPDPAALAKARSIDVEKVNSPARYTISAVLADAATAPT